MANEHQQKQMEIILGALTAGQCVLIGEWRGAKPETIPYTDKKTGQRKTFSKITHVLEVGANKTFESVDVTEMVADGVDPEKVPINFTRGQRVMVAVKSVEVDFGSRKMDCYGIVPMP